MVPNMGNDENRPKLYYTDNPIARMGLEHLENTLFTNVFIAIKIHFQIYNGL